MILSLSTSALAASFARRPAQGQSRAAVATPKREGTSLSLEAQNSQFLSVWEGYQNNNTSLTADFKHRSDHVSLGVELRFSNTPDRPVLGNLEQALYSMREGNAEIRLGRHAAVPSYVDLPFATLQRLNHSVCYTGFECSRGGFVGASAV